MQTWYCCQARMLAYGIDKMHGPATRKEKNMLNS
jgi:hypothetical protein